MAHNVIDGNDARPASPMATTPWGAASSRAIRTSRSSTTSSGRTSRAVEAASRPTAGACSFAATRSRTTWVSATTGAACTSPSPDVRVTHNLIAGNVIGRELGYGWGGGIIVFGQGTSAVLSFNDITGNSAPSVGEWGVRRRRRGRAARPRADPRQRLPDGGTTGGVGIYVDGYDTIGSQATLDHVTVAGHDCATRGRQRALRGGQFQGDDRQQHLLGQRRGRLHARIAPRGSAGSTRCRRSRCRAKATCRSIRCSPTPVGRTTTCDRSAGAGITVVDGWTLDGEHSPAIDAGDPAAPYDDEPDPNGGRADLGAYGNTIEASKSD